MYTKSLLRDLYRITDDSKQLEMGCIYSFLTDNNIQYSDSKYLCQYLSGLNGNIANAVQKVVANQNSSVSLFSLVEIFEVLVSKEQRKKNGIVYTPTEIKDYINGSVLDMHVIPIVCDPACGCGSFLISAAEYLHKKYSKSYSSIISENIYGIDVDEAAINKAKVLLYLLAYANDEKEEIHFNLLCADMLDNETVQCLKQLLPGGFDCIIGNPPYVRSRNMSEAAKKNLSNWVSASNGNVDLYMPFYEVGIRLLKSGGKLGFISPNTFLQGVNGRSLRTYFVEQGFDITIFDFRDAQIFKSVTSYTCITIIDTSIISKKINYVRINDTNSLYAHQLSAYSMYDFEIGKPWRMCESNIDDTLRKLENSGQQLQNWKIRNGLATLKNDLYFFVPTGEDDKCYYRTYNGKEYKIEKAICIDVVKPNILKNEMELKEKVEKAIFPFLRSDTGLDIIDEATLSEQYPKTYELLCDNRESLLGRDKGHGNYQAWYAYGRTQGINNFGIKLLIPYISDRPVAVLSKKESMLFYCGYALFADTVDELIILKAFLESDAFWFYIQHTSKPYAKGYMAFAKNYIVNFSIPNLTNEDKQYILTKPDKIELNQWIWRKYGLSN